MKILMITEDFPYPPSDGVRLRVYHILKGLSKRHEITLLSFIDGNDKVNIDKIKSFCEHIELIPKNPRKLLLLRVVLNLFETEPFSLSTFNSKRIRQRIRKTLIQKKIDIVHLDMPNMAQFYELVAHMPTVIDPRDSITLNLRRRYPLEKNLFQKAYQYIQWKKWKRYEAEMYAKFDKCFVVSDVDAEELRLLNSKIDIAIIPNGVDVDFFKPMRLKPDYPSLIFSGSMASFQSYDAITYFYKNIYGNVKAQVPNIKLYIVGKDPPQSVRDLTQDKSVIVTGFVEDIRPFIDRSTVYVCPIRSGSGIKNRLLEAMAMGKPIVAFTISCKALNVTHMENIFLADNCQEFTKGIITLLSNQRLREKMADNARQLVEKEYSWEKTVSIIKGAYEEAIRKKQNQVKK
ncbi:MAG: hypothetical protein B5M53_06430 [Candidatus Cloacimonas sp. 4484_209]|nr:MAG: hypothetical protein B5M53_06430 [Candidatus Cloacimonas sp. 4484_209]